jgi:hypothetical protein
MIIKAGYVVSVLSRDPIVVVGTCVGWAGAFCSAAFVSGSLNAIGIVARNFVRIVPMEIFSRAWEDAAHTILNAARVLIGILACLGLPTVEELLAKRRCRIWFVVCGIFALEGIALLRRFTAMSNIIVCAIFIRAESISSIWCFAEGLMHLMYWTL